MSFGFAGTAWLIGQEAQSLFQLGVLRHFLRQPHARSVKVLASAATTLPNERTHLTVDGPGDRSSRSFAARTFLGSWLDQNVGAAWQKRCKLIAKPNAKRVRRHRCKDRF